MAVAQEEPLLFDLVPDELISRILYYLPLKVVFLRLPKVSERLNALVHQFGNSFTKFNTSLVFSLGEVKIDPDDTI